MDNPTISTLTHEGGEYKEGIVEGGTCYDDRVKARDDVNGNIDSNPSERLGFYLLVGTQFVLGLLLLVLIAIWMGHYRGGFKWDGSGLEFNFHPLFMTIGLIFLYGDGIIVYRVLRKVPKSTTKLVHFALHFSSFVFAILGLITVFDFHNHSNIPNVYSLHSWLGLSTVVLFGCQLLFGFTGFLYPRFSQEMRETYMAIHVYFGMAIFVLAIMSCLTGATEKLLFSIPKTYSAFVPEGKLANIYGCLLVIFGGLVIFIGTKTSYKRLPDSFEYAVIQ